MDILNISHICQLASAIFLIFLSTKFLLSFWISPYNSYRKLRRIGFEGPPPSFPFGNHDEIKMMMTMKNKSCSSVDNGDTSLAINHNTHSTIFPYYASWQKSYGKVFIYWLGTEPFLYVAEPEFLRKMSEGILAKAWGKPRVFKDDREPLFGNGLNMVEGEDWVRRRHIITPAFSSFNLKEMSSLMVDSANQMLEKWSNLITSSGEREIHIIEDMITTSSDIIAKTSFGISYQSGSKVFEKLIAMQNTLFKSNRYVGVPYIKYMMNPKNSLKAKRLGKEIDKLLIEIIEERKGSIGKHHERDLLGLLLEANNNVGNNVGRSLSTRELVDECKTFFFGGQETTALVLSWTLLLLSLHQDWQTQLREEIKLVVGDKKELDYASITGLKKMGWVMNEVLRLYPSSPNVQRQAKDDIQVGDKIVPKGTNIWIDLISLHHDTDLWGSETVNEFRPERFKDDQLYGGCKHKMGFLPFGFGGRMCIGRNLAIMEYKIVLALTLSRFSISLSKNYSHGPCYMLTVRPKFGLPLIVRPL